MNNKVSRIIRHGTKSIHKSSTLDWIFSFIRHTRFFYIGKKVRSLPALSWSDKLDREHSLRKKSGLAEFRFRRLDGTEILIENRAGDALPLIYRIRDPEICATEAREVLLSCPLDPIEPLVKYWGTDGWLSLGKTMLELCSWSIELRPEICIMCHLRLGMYLILDAEMGQSKENLVK